MARRESFRASSAPGPYDMTFTIGDAAGNWSPPESLTVLLDEGAPRSLDIAGLSPATARAGDRIRILGIGFDGETPERNAVTFAGAARAVPIEGTAAWLDVIVPEDAATGEVAVENALGRVVSPLPLTIPPAIAIQPRPASMLAGASASFTATFGGSAPAAVTWTLEGMRILLSGYGSMASDGRRCQYTAPVGLPPANPLHLRCALTANAAIYDEVDFNVVLPEPTVGSALIRASTGGTLVSRDGLVGLEVLPGGLGADTTISIDTLDPASLAGSPADQMIVAAARFEAAGAQFLKPMDVDLALRAWERAGRSLSILYRNPTSG